MTSKLNQSASQAVLTAEVQALADWAEGMRMSMSR